MPAGEDELRLPRPPGVLRRSLAAHPRVMDGLVATIVLLLDWAQLTRIGLHPPFLEVVGGPLGLAASTVTSAAVLLRRTRPVVLLTVLGLAGLLELVDDRYPLIAPVAVLVYSTAAHRSASRAAGAAALLLLVDLATTGLAEGDVLAGGVVGLLVVEVIALLLGANLGARRRYLAAVLDRAAQLAVERDQRARLAVAAERARIARELHDVVAHGLSVVVRLSDGADAVAQTDPARSREAVRQIGRVGRESLTEMRRLLGVLAEDAPSPDLAPQPSLDDLDPLVATYRAAGLPVTIERRGAARLDRATQLVVYRTVQEGLTNALRYARTPSRVDVRLFLDEVVEVEIADDGAARSIEPSVGSGRGLVGLRERANLYGGDVEAGRRDDLDGHGWRTVVRLPLSTMTRTTEAG